MDWIVVFYKYKMNLNKIKKKPVINYNMALFISSGIQMQSACIYRATHGKSPKKPTIIPISKQTAAENQPP